MQQKQQKYDSLIHELEQLKLENARLKELLHANGIAYDVVSTDVDEEKVYSDISFPDVHLGKDERVELFRSLFRGREDVFARRWYSKATNKGGYQPVCVNEWRRGICDKKAVKCTDCPNRNFLPLGYDEICRHLIGNDENGCDVVGIYAIMQDNNCFEQVIVSFLVLHLKRFCFYALGVLFLCFRPPVSMLLDGWKTLSPALSLERRGSKK